MDLEAGRIVGLHQRGLSERAIADRVGRSRGCVRSILAKARGGAPPTTKKKDPKLKVSKRDAHALVREASKTGKSARKIKAAIGEEVSERTVCRVLARADFLAYSVMEKQLSSWHNKQARMACAKRRVILEGGWKVVIFSDAKRFCIDGPHGFQVSFGRVCEAAHLWSGERSATMAKAS